MKYKIDDKLVCLDNINNIIGNLLYEKGEIYNVFCVFDGFITLNHNLIGNEYGALPEHFVSENFITQKEERKMKLEKINDRH